MPSLILYYLEKLLLDEKYLMHRSDTVKPYSTDYGADNALDTVYPYRGESR